MLFHVFGRYHGHQLCLGTFTFTVPSVIFPPLPMATAATADAGVDGDDIRTMHHRSAVLSIPLLLF